jgi:hypothetical protein
MFPSFSRIISYFIYQQKIWGFKILMFCHLEKKYVPVAINKHVGTCLLLKDQVDLTTFAKL